MRRYFQITKILFRTSFIRDTQFRSAFFADLVSVIIWNAMYVIIVLLIYGHTQEVFGWNKGNLFVLLGVWTIIDDLLGATVWKGLMDIPEAIAEGKLDFVLTKPVDSQFLLVSQRFYFVRLVTLLFGIVITIYGLRIGGVGNDLLNLAAFPVLLLCGYIIAFSMFMFLETLGFWFLRINDIWALWDGVSSLGKYPLDVFGRPVKFIILTVVPLFVAFLYPAQALLGRLSPWQILYAPILAALFFWLTRKFYQHSVRRYSSVA